MDPIIALIVLLLVVYPYWLVVRFLQLGCKVFKKYLREDDMNPFVFSYGDEDDD